jgi:hypothetical protein
MDGLMIDGLMIDGLMIDGLMIDGLMIDGLMIDGLIDSWPPLEYMTFGHKSAAIPSSFSCIQQCTSANP